MSIAVANAPVSWGIMEVDGWNPPLPAGQFLDELVSAGYQATELGPYGYLPTDPVRLRGELTRRSVSLISAFVPLRLKEPGADLEPVRQAGALLGALGAKHVVLADAMWPEREAVSGRAAEAGVKLAEPEWRIVAENIGAAIEAAKEFGLRSVIHHHAGTYIETPEEIDRLLAITSLGLCLDTGHYVIGGGDPVEAVKRYGARVEYLHFKDVDAGKLKQARERKLGFLDAVRSGVFCPLGQGCVKFPELIRELEAAGYRGWAVVEQDVETSEESAVSPLDCAIASRQYLKTALGI